MKLYNLYEGLILETIEVDNLIGNDIDSIIKGHTAKNGRKYWNPVRITYRSDKSGGEKTTRQVMIYGKGILNNKKNPKQGNPGIRVFQAFGPGENAKWKTFKISNITHIEVIDFNFYMQPSDVSGSSGIPDFLGPADKSFQNGLTHSIKFDN